MMRQIRKLLVSFLLTLALCLTVFCPVAAKTAYPKPTDDFFVNDFAGLLKPADQAKMQQAGEALYHATTAQVVVVTVDSLEGQSIEEYAIYLAREWGIGNAEKDNGLLLLLAKNEREVRVEVGSGLEGAVTDVGAWQITQHYGIEHFKADRFSEGLTAMYEALVNEVYLEYGKQPSDGYVPIEELEDAEGERGDSPFRYLAILAVIALAIAFSRRRRGGGGHGGHGGGLPFFFFMPGGFRGGHGGGFHGGGGFSGGGFRGGGGGFSGGGSSSKF